MSQHITVVDYNPLWQEKYEKEARLIRKILADNCIAIYHIGSTSVKGLAAKPIIDIMVAVRSLEKVDNVAKDFKKLDYEYLGEFGIKGSIFAKVEMSEHIKFIFFKWTIGTILEGILRFAIICAHMKKSERNTQKLK